MSFFAPQTKVIDLGDGNTVTLRKLTYAEVLDAYDSPMGEERPGIVITQRSIVHWDGDGFDGRAATPENFMALPGNIAYAILQESAKFNRLSEDEGNASGVATN